MGSSIKQKLIQIYNDIIQNANCHENLSKVCVQSYIHETGAMQLSFPKLSWTTTVETSPFPSLSCRSNQLINQF